MARSVLFCSIYLLFLFICYMNAVHCIFYVAGHWARKNIPDSYKKNAQIIKHESY